MHRHGQCCLFAIAAISVEPAIIGRLSMTLVDYISTLKRYYHASFTGMRFQSKIEKRLAEVCARVSWINR